MQIVSACIVRDLPVYSLTYRSLIEHMPGAEIHVVTRKEDFAKFKDACGPELHLWDEADFVPEMTLRELRKMPLASFPNGAGWYFQQFLKYAFVNVSNDDEYYLIWDADTVLLRPLEFFTPEGKPFYTTATEHHLPYFETFEALFGFPAKREFSFISQHQIINKAYLREMMAIIESRNPASRNWAWAIMENVRGAGSNLFSEYETYGHYVKARYPESIAVRSLNWTRNGERWAGYPPKASKLGPMAAKFDYASFEAFFSLRNRLKRYAMKLFGRKPITDYPD